MKYRDKLDQMEARYAELTAQMADPAVISDGETYRKVAKTHSDLTEVVTKYRDYKVAEDELNQAKTMLNEDDPDLREMARLEIEGVEPRMVQIEQDLKVLLLPKDPLRSEEHTSELQSHVNLVCR